MVGSQEVQIFYDAALRGLPDGIPLPLGRLPFPPLGSEQVPVG